MFDKRIYIFAKIQGKDIERMDKMTHLEQEIISQQSMEAVLEACNIIENALQGIFDDVATTRALVESALNIGKNGERRLS